MKNIDYGNLIFSKRIELDKMAYSKYYNDYKNIIIEDKDEIIIEDIEDDPLTFNEWYGTKYHKKYITPLLRKIKLEKINNYIKQKKSI